MYEDQGYMSIKFYIKFNFFYFCNLKLRLIILLFVFCMFEKQLFIHEVQHCAHLSIWDKYLQVTYVWMRRNSTCVQMEQGQLLWAKTSSSPRTLLSIKKSVILFLIFHNIFVLTFIVIRLKTNLRTTHMKNQVLFMSLTYSYFLYTCIHEINV